MDGVSTLNLPPGSYEITPSTDLVEVLSSPTAVLSLAGRSEFRLHDIVDSTETRVLEVILRIPDENSDGITIRSSSSTLLFRPPGEDPVLSVEVGSPITTFTFRDLTSMDRVAGARQSLHVLGKWQLQDENGDHRASLKRGSVRNLLPWTRYGTYVLRTTDGIDAARYDHVQAEVDSDIDPPSAFEIAVEESSIPTEIVLAFAYAVHEQAHSSSSSAGSVGDGVE